VIRVRNCRPLSAGQDGGTAAVLPDPVEALGESAFFREGFAQGFELFVQAVAGYAYD